MIDTYLKSKSEETIADYCSYFINAMVPIKCNDKGGDTECWYTCIRAPFVVSAVDGVEIVNEAEGRAVCGVWA